MREIEKLGHTVRLLPPAYVKAYVKRSKNDAADAAAICGLQLLRLRSTALAQSEAHDLDARCEAAHRNDQGVTPGSHHNSSAVLATCARL